MRFDGLKTSLWIFVLRHTKKRRPLFGMMLRRAQDAKRGFRGGEALTLVRLDIGFEDSIHTRQVSPAVGFEKRQHVGINAQMHRLLCPGQHQFGTRPEIGAKVFRKTRPWRPGNLASGLHRPKLG